ncbi:hypothetical protein GCM10009799_30800 [Nocardiopsis rhodophaea]|uniref:Uncharacterized protein n=1 Tax=Nocardiopsis rhodophaea TaxID=280238 RepID=A0ABN2TAD8_9ACTN
MSILPSRRSRRVRPYIAALEAQRASEERRFREFAGVCVRRESEVAR